MRKSVAIACLLLAACVGEREPKSVYLPPTLGAAVAATPPASLEAAAASLRAAADGADVETVATFLAPEVSVFGRPVDFAQFDGKPGRHSVSERRVAALGRHTGSRMAGDSDEITWYAKEELSFLSRVLRSPEWGADPQVPDAICSYRARRPSVEAIEAARKVAIARTMDLALPRARAAVQKAPAPGSPVIGELAPDRYYVARQAGTDAPGWYAVFMPDGQTGYVPAASTVLEFLKPSLNGVCFRQGPGESWTIVSQIYGVGT